MAQAVDLNQLVGYDRFGSDWDANWGEEGYWDAKTTAGRTNWTNWARRATDTDWETLATQLEQDPTELQSSIKGTLGTEDPPQVYQPDLFPTAFSGIEQGYMDQIMGAVVPQLTDSIQNHDTNINQYTKEAFAQNRNASKGLLDSVLQSSVNSLNSRGILNSKVAENTMGNATGEVFKNLNNQNLQSSMEAAKLKIGAPSMLGQIANLGKYSLSEDPSVPQQLLSRTITGIA